MNWSDDFDGSAHGFLNRAKQRLLEPQRASLLYAALELRYCIEERQDAYVQAQTRYMDSIPAAHKIGHQGAALKKIFDDELILRITLSFDGVDPITLHYVPVTPKLRSLAEKLGNILHVTKIPSKSDFLSWGKTRDDLLKLYRGAWMVCRGDLLSPIMLSREGEAVGAIEFAGKRNDRLIELIQMKGAKFKMTVAHLRSCPVSWVPDI